MIPYTVSELHIIRASVDSISPEVGIWPFYNITKTDLLHKINTHIEREQRRGSLNHPHTAHREHYNAEL